VLDDNDNAPLFSQNTYSESVRELTKVGSTLVTVEADDIDEGVNKAVSIAWAFVFFWSDFEKTNF